MSRRDFSVPKTYKQTHNKITSFKLKK